MIERKKLTEEHKNNIRKSLNKLIYDPNEFKNCKRCGKIFFRNIKYNGIWANKKYCSTKCLRKDRYENYIIPHRKTERYKEKHKEHAKKHREKYLLEVKTRNKSYYHIKIPKDYKCDICKNKLAKERHHQDYNKPLEVLFLCIKCHKALHNGGK